MQQYWPVLAVAFVTLSATAPAQSTVSGHRFRGASQSDRERAVQRGITIAHAGGFHAGTWASGLAGRGTFGGYGATLADGATLDIGRTRYMYPGGADATDFAEPGAKVTGTIAGGTVVASLTAAS